jgi:hypothetical protein
MNKRLVKILALKLWKEMGFNKVQIFFLVFLIIRLFDFIPYPYRTLSSYKDAKVTILKRILRKYLYEAGCSNLLMKKWWENSHPLPRYRLIDAIYNHGCFKPWKFKLLYSTSIHGFSNAIFHNLCDNQGPTMTIMNFNGNKIVVAFLEKYWNTQDVLKLGYQEDRSSKMFHVTKSGEIVTLKCGGFYNYLSSGPDFKFLEVNLDKRKAASFFPENNRQITGYSNYSFVTVGSVVVLKMNIDFKSFPNTLLMAIASAAAPYLSIAHN